MRNILVTAFALAAVASACGPQRPDGGVDNGGGNGSCPSPVCNMACMQGTKTGLVKDANGCDVCTCVADAPAVCADDSACAGGLVCDRTHYCESPAGCGQGGKECPTVCAGRCVQ